MRQLYPDTSRLPDALETDRYRAPYAAGIADLDADGHQDLIIGAKGGMADESFIYWGEADGEFRATAPPHCRRRVSLWPSAMVR